jgi:hypothetical protein
MSTLRYGTTPSLGSRSSEGPHTKRIVGRLTEPIPNPGPWHLTCASSANPVPPCSIGAIRHQLKALRSRGPVLPRDEAHHHRSQPRYPDTIAGDLPSSAESGYQQHRSWLARRVCGSGCHDRHNPDLVSSAEGRYQLWLGSGSEARFPYCRANPGQPTSNNALRDRSMPRRAMRGVIRRARSQVRRQGLCEVGNGGPDLQRCLLIRRR